MTERLVIPVSPAELDQLQMSCPFCGRSTPRSDEPGMYDGSLWRCACGGFGLSCNAADLDEASDQMFAVLGIDASFSEPAVPVGTSGRLSMQRYDSPKLLRQLTAFFEGRGHRVHFQEVDFLLRSPTRPELRYTTWFFWTCPPNGTR